VSARAKYSIAKLFYALGDDAAAVSYYGEASRLVESIVIDGIAAAVNDSDALSHLKQLGAGVMPGRICASALTLLTSGNLVRIATDVDHLPSNKGLPSASHTLEYAERLKLLWRMRVITRASVLQVLTTTEPRDPNRVHGILTELSNDVHLAGPLDKAYIALDNVWLLRHGGLQISTSVGAGLCDLLDAVPKDDVSTMEALATRAFTLGFKN